MEFRPNAVRAIANERECDSGSQVSSRVDCKRSEPTPGDGDTNEEDPKREGDHTFSRRVIVLVGNSCDESTEKGGSDEFRIPSGTEGEEFDL